MGNWHDMSFDDAAAALIGEFPESTFKFGMDDASHLYMAPESRPFPAGVEPYEDGIPAEELNEYRAIENITSAISVWQKQSKRNDSKLLSKDDWAEAFNQAMKKGASGPAEARNTESSPSLADENPQVLETGDAAGTSDQALAALEGENIRLKQENAALQERITQLENDSGANGNDDLQYLADELKKLRQEKLNLEVGLNQARTELEQWRAGAGQLTENN
ncbi:hypothetical protein ACFL4W_01400 [Planctomycetota bacterium]